MTTIDTNEPSVVSAFRDAAARGARTPKPADPANDQGRTVNDTVELSEGGQKIVNLARGAELGADIKSASVDENFAAKLKDATDDVFRIGELFRATSRALFGWLNPRA